MAKVYVTRNWFPAVLQRLFDLHDVKVWEGEDSPPRDVLLSEVRDVDGLLPIGADHIDAEVIRAGRKLRVISNFGDGYEHIALEEATRRGIPVGNTPDVLTETTADLIFALILAAARRIVEGDAFTRQGRWRMHAHLDLPGVDVHHATLGIVGLGKIGSHVAKRAKAFNMRVLYYSKSRKTNMESLLGVEWAPELHSLLSQSDFVALTPRLTEETRHMIGRDEFAVMKPNAVLVNGARGAVIDEKALFEALSSRRILRAALDVTEIEPLPVDDPLLTLDNLIVMPHIGSAVPATREKMMAMAVDQMILGLNGERIPNCVNPVVYRVES